MYAVNSFLTAFLMRYHQMGLKPANNVASIVLGAVGILGLLGGGWAADRWSRTRADGRLLLSALAMLVAAPCIYFALQQPSGAIVGFMLLMGTGSMLMFIYYSCVYAAIQDVIEPALRGTAMALYFFAMYVLGASLGPLLTGMLSDYSARRAMTAAGATVMTEPFKAIGLHDAMLVIPVLCLALAGVLYARLADGRSGHGAAAGVAGVAGGGNAARAPLERGARFAQGVAGFAVAGLPPAWAASAIRKLFRPRLRPRRPADTRRRPVRFY